MKLFYRFALLGCTLFSSPAFSCDNMDIDPSVETSPKLSEFATTLLNTDPGQVEDYLYGCARKSIGKYCDDVACLRIELREIKTSKINTNASLQRLQEIYKIAEKVANSLEQ